MVILHIGIDDLKSNHNLLNIAIGIINLAKNIKGSGMKASISFLTPRGDRLSEKGKKLTKNVPQSERCFYISQ